MQRRNALEGGRIAISAPRPWGFVLIFNSVDYFAGGVLEFESFAVVAEFLGEGGEGFEVVKGLEALAIATEDEVAFRRDDCFGRKGVIETFDEGPTGNVSGIGAGVVEFDKLEVIEIAGSVVEDFVNDDGSFGRWLDAGGEKE
jgi:hypothetical protein